MPNNNFEIFQYIKTLEKEQFRDYFNNTLIPVYSKDPAFLRQFYKDLIYLIVFANKVLNRDIKESDFLFTNSDFVLSNSQKRFKELLDVLHDCMFSQLLLETKDIADFCNRIDFLENTIFNNFKYPKDFENKVALFIKQTKTERKDLNKPLSISSPKHFFIDLIEFKDTEIGIGFNKNAIISKYWK